MGIGKVLRSVFRHQTLYPLLYTYKLDRSLSPHDNNGNLIFANLMAQEIYSNCIEKFWTAYYYKKLTINKKIYMIVFRSSRWNRNYIAKGIKFNFFHKVFMHFHKNHIFYVKLQTKQTYKHTREKMFKCISAP